MMGVMPQARSVVVAGGATAARGLPAPRVVGDLVFVSGTSARQPGRRDRGRHALLTTAG